MNVSWVFAIVVIFFDVSEIVIISAKLKKSKSKITYEHPEVFYGEDL
jgi:hypothetical protein